MQWLRTTALIARLALAWFVLSLGVAVASPLVKPQALELVCGAGASAKLVVLDDEGRSVAAGHHALDCPACLAATLAPPVITLQLPAAAPAPLAQHPFHAAHLAALTGAPLPPRGPPASA
ncbi:DUF2946 domain-containing protein [Xenophilus sp. Marseille-Q4582]|uniref:DUF2946 domain-containing protein n=1 Tax=Xenophilus sp. Marseille-Q4582 TaxID=2866600 RepID=UPI001CE400C2|nr:DUF2946 domain-containing protein [Xenophilus sp. Marseille-Q4582]